MRSELPSAKTLLQVVSVFCMSFILSTIFRKGYADISVIAQQHSGGEFWLSLARYFLRNLAGGASPGS
jgi:hypothetical protein